MPDEIMKEINEMIEAVKQGAADGKIDFAEWARIFRETADVLNQAATIFEDLHVRFGNILDFWKKRTGGG